MPYTLDHDDITLSALAGVAYDALEARTRDGGERFTTQRDDAPSSTRGCRTGSSPRTAKTARSTASRARTDLDRDGIHHFNGTTREMDLR